MKEFLGDDADGLSDSAVSKKAIKRWLKSITKSYVRRNDSTVVAAVTAAQDALTTAEAARVTEQAARKTAESDRDATVVTAFGDDS